MRLTNVPARLQKHGFEGMHRDPVVRAVATRVDIVVAVPVLPFAPVNVATIPRQQRGNVVSRAKQGLAQPVFATYDDAVVVGAQLARPQPENARSCGQLQTYGSEHL